MNRRPKLSLISNGEPKKKQALDFEASELSNKQPDMGLASEPTDEVSHHEPIRPVRLISEQEKKRQPKSSAWPNGKVILKAVVVVTAFALSVYLLKRRLL